MSPSLNPKRTIAELKELRALTGDENGAQRVAFTKTWTTARAWLKSKLEALPVEVHTDAAGNLWATLAGDSPRALVLGGHLDSVPNGGWLDGSLNELTGLEVLRRVNSQYAGRPPVTVRLVDWADEEGARFGKSLFGSSACSGNLDLAEARGLKDKDGIPLAEALKEVGVDLERAKECGKELANAAAYLELHIEQGPVLLDLDLPLGAVLGTFGVERHAISFHGQAAHSGSTPMNRRRDAFLAAAKMSPEIYRIARRHRGVCTIGSCVTRPGIVTSVVEDCRITLDQRHLDAAALARMLKDAKEAAARFARDGKVEAAWERLWRIEPVLFNEELIALCDDAIRETSGRSLRLPSGPLHDAAEVARAGVPTAMMFVQSLHGISHNKIEDTREEHIEASVRAFDRLADKAMQWVGAQTKPARTVPARLGERKQQRLSMATINQLTSGQFVRVIGPVFEGSPWIAKAAAASRPFANLDAMHTTLVAIVRGANRRRQIALIRAHPDLAGRAARAGTLSGQSAREQTGAGLGKLSPAEIALFEASNRAYRKKFGFPFVICARLNKKPAILKSLERRLKNTPEEELNTALKEIAKIARLRLEDLVDEG